MGKPWREVVQVSAIYYQAGEFPNTPDGSDDTEWTDGPDVWWYPGVDADYRKLLAYEVAPPTDEAKRLETDAIKFAFSVVGNAAHEDWDDIGGLIANEIINAGEVLTFCDHVDALKACCDLVRGASTHRYVTALVVFECDAGKDADTWLGPGEWWSKMEVLGVLDLNKAEVTRVTAAAQSGKE